MSYLMYKLSRILRPISENYLKTNVMSCVQVRHRKLREPRKHVEPHFVRKQMLAICEPVFLKDKRLDSDKCAKLVPKPDRQIHPYDKLLAEDMKSELSSSRMVCFYHQNVTKNREKTLYKNEFEHELMYLRYYNPDIAQLAMAETKYATALHLCGHKDVTVLFSAEPQVSKMLKLNKKCPNLILMAAIIDHRFMSVSDLREYSRLPDLHSIRAQLSHTLSMASQSIANKTVYPISRLTSSLDSYVRQQQK